MSVVCRSRAVLMAFFLPWLSIRFISFCSLESAFFFSICLQFHAKYCQFMEFSCVFLIKRDVYAKYVIKMSILRVKQLEIAIFIRDKMKKKTTSHRKMWRKFSLRCLLILLCKNFQWKHNSISLIWHCWFNDRTNVAVLH